MENRVYFVVGASSDIGIAFIKSLEEKCLRQGESAMVLAHYAFHADTLLAVANTVKAL